jgi:hypothetical protein
VPCFAHLLTIAGGLTEIGGLGLVIAEIINVQRREFPERRGWVRSALAWLRRLGRKPPPKVIDVGGTVDVTGTFSARVTKADPGKDAPTTERVNWLAQQLEELRQLTQQDKNELRRAIAAVRAATTDELAELRTAVQQREEDRREGLADALLLQKIGTAAFMVGVGLSVWGNLAPC